MNLKPTRIQIPEDDPFKEDLLSRKESAEILTEFVRSISEPFVLAIDSPFGTGKTTFLKMWLQHLRNAGFACLDFNAWENDFSESPLVSLIGELGAGMESLRLGNKEGELTRKVLEKTKKAGAALLKAALPTTIKIATSGLLDISALKEDLAKLGEDIAKEQIEKYEAGKKTIRKFREDLGKLVEAVAGQREPDQRKPVVFVIDELDRCRPSYAVGLLEKVKHLFSVDGLVFVLGIDRHQLAQSVRSLYGSGMDADGYLRRFIDLDYRLPEPDHKKFAEAQFARFGLDGMLNARRGSPEHGVLRRVVPKLFEVFRFSLRTQEQCFTRVAIVLRTTPPTSTIHSVLLALLICIREAERQLYLDYCNGQAGPEEVLKYLRSQPGGSRLVASELGALIEAHLIKGIRDEARRSAALDRCFASAAAQAADLVAGARAKEVSKDFQWIGAGTLDMTEYLYKKIEMAHRFVAQY